MENNNPEKTVGEIVEEALSTSYQNVKFGEEKDNTEPENTTEYESEAEKKHRHHFEKAVLKKAAITAGLAFSTVLYKEFVEK